MSETHWKIHLFSLVRIKLLNQQLPNLTHNRKTS